MVFNATFNNISAISWRSIFFIGGGDIYVLSKSDFGYWNQISQLNSL
jgi:hypothetical protein